jgi:hypothetical protein
VDERTGLKNYIASEDLGITTSAGMVRSLLRRCIDLGRRSGGRGPDFHEALRLLGTATHCLEDYSAHSNYAELVLIELGERDIFPHVGRSAVFQVQDARKQVYPIVTGTFGGVDFLHSVCGEISDKTTQSELQELQGAITDADRTKNKSKIKDLLSQLPDGIFGGKDQAGKADELENNANAASMGNLHVSPKDPEAFTEQLGELVKQIYPVMEFHDEIMQSISEFIEKIPILPEMIEQLQEQVTVFVFSLLAPFVLPILDQVKTELETGSSEVIASSREKQHIVFNDDYSTDPTHSMLSKDHFSNILNEPAGRVASAVLSWAVPQIVQCWDGEADTDETIDRIIDGVFHHPACRQGRVRGSEQCRSIMFQTVEKWWRAQPDQNDLRRKLSRSGVQNGENHKPGQHDKGHGCGKPLGMANDFSGIIGGKGGNKQAQQVSQQAGKLVGDAVGGGALGGLVGGLVGGIGGSLLGDAFGGDEKKSKKSEKYGNDGSYTQSYSESGRHQASSYNDSDRVGQASYQETQYPGGGRREEYSRHEQDERGGSYGYQQKVETSNYGGSGGYERREERVVESGNQWRSEEKREGFDRSGEYYSEEKEYVPSQVDRTTLLTVSRRHGKSHKKHSDDDDDESNDEDSYEKRQKKERKRREKAEKEERKKAKKYGGRDDDSDDDADKRHSGSHRSRSREQEHRRKKSKSPSPKRHSGGYGQEPAGYGGRQESSGYGRQEESGYGRQETSGYGRQEESGYGRQQESSDYGRQQESSGYGGDSYSSRRQERSEYGSSRNIEEPYGASGVPGGFGDDEPQREAPAYGRRRDNDEDLAYGGERQEFGYGGGEEESYGRRY